MVARGFRGGMMELRKSRWDTRCGGEEKVLGVVGEGYGLCSLHSGSGYSFGEYGGICCSFA